jgi:glutamate carboxypeptidase
MRETRPPDLLDALRERVDEMVDDLGAIVRAESPSHDLDSLTACAGVAAGIGARDLGPPERLESGGRVHLRWRWGRPRVLLLGHYDTVWPRGTVERWDFEVKGERATGPGVFDMKAGIVQGLHALTVLDDLEGVEVLFTGDEEIGAPTSRPILEEAARNVRAVLVLEPSADGALKIARKGGALYRIAITGLAAHAGLEPEKGVNALLEAAHLALAVAELARPEAGTTVTPTMLSAGSATNTVPAAAILQVDSRAATIAEQQRVDDALRATGPTVEGARLDIDGGIDRPPLPRSISKDLFARARDLATELGIDDLQGAEVGGGSDGNFTAAVGTPTLDGLGAVGAGAHAEGEWIAVDRMAERAALVASLTDELRR